MTKRFGKEERREVSIGPNGGRMGLTKQAALVIQLGLQLSKYASNLGPSRMGLTTYYLSWHVFFLFSVGH